MLNFLVNIFQQNFVILSDSEESNTRYYNATIRCFTMFSMTKATP